MKAGAAAHELFPTIAKPGEWAQRGSCVGTSDPDLWFADDRGKGHQPAVELAIQICKGCSVRKECLSWGLSIDRAQDWGVLGATTAQERRQLRRAA